jgi:hypothetical protein
MSYKEDSYYDESGAVQGKSKDTLNMFLDNTEKYECKIPCYINGKKRLIKCYQSKAKIRNAVTGILSEHAVGSSMEDLYFKAGAPSIGGPFYYNGPEEFERHMFTTLDDTTKTNWHAKASRARKTFATT